MKRIILIALSFVSLVISAQEKKIITTSTPFLLIPTDARAGGMADIGVATTPDSYAIFHNAAKTAFNKNAMSIGLNYTPWLRNVTDDIFVGGVSFINRFQENSSWGVDIKYFSIGTIETYNDTGIKGNDENLNDLAITGIYSMKLSENFSMGIGLKYINSNYAIRSTDSNIKPVNSFAVDISGYYQSNEENYGSFNGRYRLGFNIANIGPKVEYTPGNENFIPTNLKLGGGFDFILDDYNTIAVNTEFRKLLVSSDQTEGWLQGIFSSFGDGFDGSSFSIGGEYLYNEAFAVRAGYYNEIGTSTERNFLTLGAGFSARSFSLGLSYLMNTSNINDPLENTLRFSLAFDFGDIFEVE